MREFIVKTVEVALAIAVGSLVTGFLLCVFGASIRRDLEE